MDDFYLEQFIEDDWNKFLNTYSRDYENVGSEVIEKTSYLDIPEDLKIVLICKLGSYLNEWLNKSIPALGNKNR